MELVTSDFLKFSVENSLRKFFRVVRSEKSSMVRSFANPVECASYLKSLFDTLSLELGNYQLRAVDEAYFRKRLVSRGVKSQEIKLATKVKDGGQLPASKICSGHLGKHLKLKNKDGATYKCEYGAACRFGHPFLKSASEEKIQLMIETLPLSVQPLFKKDRK